MAFEDLFLDDAEREVGTYIPYTVSSSLLVYRTVIDTDGSVMRFSPGYTAAMTLNLPDGSDVAVFTETPTSGRYIDLNPGADYSFVIRSSPAGMAVAGLFERRALAFNLIITRTSDGLAWDAMTDCYLTANPELGVG